MTLKKVLYSVINSDMLIIIIIIIIITGELNMCYVEANGNISDPDSNIYGINSKVTITEPNKT